MSTQKIFVEKLGYIPCQFFFRVIKNLQTTELELTQNCFFQNLFSMRVLFPCPQKYSGHGIRLTRRHFLQQRSVSSFFLIARF